jgi:hypothetical protein
LKNRLVVWSSRTLDESTINSLLIVLFIYLDRTNVQALNKISKINFDNSFFLIYIMVSAHTKKMQIFSWLSRAAQNHQINVKYKTKECENFKNNLCCIYGNRWNFIHIRGIFLYDFKNNKNEVELEIVRRSARPLTFETAAPIAWLKRLIILINDFNSFC